MLAAPDRIIKGAESVHYNVRQDSVGHVSRCNGQILIAT